MVFSASKIASPAGRWTDQHGVSLSAPVKPGSEPELLRVLAGIGARVEATGEPFGRSPHIHYARFVFIPGDVDPNGGQVGPTIMYLADFDGPVEQHLGEIAEIAAREFDQIGEHCQEPIPK